MYENIPDGMGNQTETVTRPEKSSRVSIRRLPVSFRLQAKQMDPILKKLMFKGQSPVLLVNAPPEFKTTTGKFGVAMDEKPKGTYMFALGFVKSLAEADKLARIMRRALEDQAVFWMAYPKGTSKNYKNVDINRDTGGARMGTHGFQGVSMVAIDEDWSAIRFKRTD